MKNFVSTVVLLLAALPLLLLEGLFAVALGLSKLWETWLRAARELGEAPPNGGMYGTTARRLRERARSETCLHHDKTTATDGGRNG